MLFNAPEFLFGFLPAVLLGFFVIGRYARPYWAMLWLVVASLFFYGWWRPELVLLILGSAVVNYMFGVRLGRSPGKALLAVGIGFNLVLLGWFKYSGFLADLINEVAAAGLPLPSVVLPLGISFYTFQQIAYLVDANAGDARETDFTRYLLFVTFFPQLVAGPIVHHREMLSQFSQPETYRPRLSNLMLGLTAFSIGLFKKVFIADPLGSQAQLAFGPAADGVVPMFGDAWYGTLAYGLQLYFDFSGYSDMAIGLGLMFGISLPLNFASSFKSASIIEFWSRWHMTLTRFLTAYIYNPIVVAVTRRRVAAGKPLWRNKKPRLAPFAMQLALPTLITMGLAGIWHGAGWQFLAFGLCHGFYLVTNHGWRAVRYKLGWAHSGGVLAHGACVLLTFFSVIVSFVFFRADSLPHAVLILQAMAGYGGEFQGIASMSDGDLGAMSAFSVLVARLTSMKGLLIVGCLAAVWTLPNTAQITERISAGVARRVADRKLSLRWPLFRWDPMALLPFRNRFLQGSCVGVLLALALLRVLSVAPTEFLYFTF